MSLMLTVREAYLVIIWLLNTQHGCFSDSILRPNLGLSPCVNLHFKHHAKFWFPLLTKIDFYFRCAVIAAINVVLAI